MARILFDMDCTGVDFLGPLVKLINKGRGTNDFTAAHFVDWDMQEGLTPQENETIFSTWQAPGYLHQLQPFPGFVSTVKWAQEQGHEVLISTAVKSPHGAEEKIRWILTHLDFLSIDDCVFTEKKQIIQADVLIDDNPRQILNYRKEHPNALIIAPAYNYNKNVKIHCIRVNGCLNMGRFWNSTQNLLRNTL